MITEFVQRITRITEAVAFGLQNCLITSRGDGRQMIRHTATFASQAVPVSGKIPSKIGNDFVEFLQEVAFRVMDVIHEIIIGVIWLIGAIPRQILRVLTSADPNDELYPWKFSNWLSVIRQIASAIALPLMLQISVLLDLYYMLPGNDQPTLVTSQCPTKSSKYPEEKWFFVNGIATDKNWLRRNLKKLEVRFNQPVTGIYNGTYGAPVDLLVCILHQQLMARTKAVRDVERVIRKELLGGNTIRILAHSQGSLILRIAVENVCKDKNELIATRLGNLHVHTFASPARNWKFQNGKHVATTEHYANELDGVAMFGVLDPEFTEQYKGNIYIRPGESGHIFNPSYSLDAHDYVWPEEEAPVLATL
ncbi:hypothetical protein BKA69DRAFT_1061502 [Paraphysoderma sedebokerense]|nr:hypothetical protein BKA69DRAFT_1061502 [Paraphysoderma sedebokerense]